MGIITTLVVREVARSDAANTLWRLVLDTPALADDISSQSGHWAHTGGERKAAFRERLMYVMHKLVWASADSASHLPPFDAKRKVRISSPGCVSCGLLGLVRKQGEVLTCTLYVLAGR